MKLNSYEEEYVLETIDTDEVLERAERLREVSDASEPFLITRGTLANRRLIVKVENETVTGTYLRG